MKYRKIGNSVLYDLYKALYINAFEEYISENGGKRLIIEKNAKINKNDTL